MLPHLRNLFSHLKHLKGISMNTTGRKINLPRIIFLYALLFLSTAQIAFGQDTDVTECPYFNVNSTDSTGVVFLLSSTSVDATISGVIANVIVEQTYLNAGDSIVDATYVFPMASKAAIYGMEMDVNDRTIVAEIRRRSEAEEIFESADSSGLTASLLEQERPNVFQMSLANIQPGDSITVRMVYTELLVPTGGVYQFVFPNIVGPRFTTNGEPWVNQVNQDSLNLSATDLNFNLKINSGMPVEAECLSHNAIFESEGNSTQTSVSTNPGDDFIVSYTLDDESIETGLLLYEGPEENFFLSMIQPARPDVPFESPQREYIFIMDVSGSMGGTPIAISQLLINSLLSDLNSDDRFNILFFAGGSSYLAPNSLEVTSENITLAMNMINNMEASGGTQLLPAMEQALGMQGTEGYSRTFVILTDGYVTVEKPAFELIRENMDEANFFSFGIGTSVNRYIIEGIAYVGEGEAFVVTDFAEAEIVADAFKEYIERPVLTNIIPTFEGIEVYDVEPLTVPDVFAERPIIIYGKYNAPAEGTITIQGDYAGGEISSTLNFADYTVNTEENIALQYLWARKRIRLMSDYGIASNETDTISIEEEITQLGLQYSLITEFTSFVAVDSFAVSANSGGDSGGDEGGPVVDTESLGSYSATERNILKVVGTITDAESLLKLQIENLNSFKLEDLSVQITGLNGQVFTYQDLAPTGEADIVTVPLIELPAGIYFVSLFSKSVLLDTEKFIMMK